ncbi:glycosyltransferase [Noviherbaspirillum pedocola]|uniref:Glycosyltransferase n=1 Tax=Noviherbaspirillum pedocola TaxID=2801341 RepID=A0A934T0Z7_9BURK|nr:glycosyltransferase [Noviherbaspirillum pedocola]MBK4739040.1 glycosyltransferase [Noviherbaspirillum pedocola]
MKPSIRSANKKVSTNKPSTIADSWYAEALADGRNGSLNVGPATPGVMSVDALLHERYPRASRIAQRSALLRGLLWFVAANRVQRIVCTMHARGVVILLLLEALFYARGRVCLVEFIRPAPSGVKERIKELLYQVFFRLVLPRAVQGVQVMTAWEVDAYARRYGLPASMFRFIAFPMMLAPSCLPPGVSQPKPRVLSSGRAACDWATLLAAAHGADWELTVICSEEDRPHVDRLNRDGQALVLSEISTAMHERLLRESDVFALVLKEQHASSGQVRLGRAIEAGIPVVATSVRGLQGYLEDGVTGIAVPVGDAAALGTAIDALLAQPEARECLRQRAFEAMRPRTLRRYMEEIRAFCLPGSDIGAWRTAEGGLQATR